VVTALGRKGSEQKSIKVRVDLGELGLVMIREKEKEAENPPSRLVRSKESRNVQAGKRLTDILLAERIGLADEKVERRREGESKKRPASSSISAARPKTARVDLTKAWFSAFPQLDSTSPLALSGFGWLSLSCK
jgi:hypothetical protein